MPVGKQAPEMAAAASAATGLTETASGPQIAALELPESSVRQYLARFGIATVYVIAGPTGCPCVIGSGRDLATEVAAARRTWPQETNPPILAGAWWVFDLRAAQQIVSLAIASDLRSVRRDGQRFAIDVSEAATAIAVAAGRLRFRLTDHGAVMARAKAAGVAMEDRLAMVQDAGQLKAFNQEYARRRRAAQAAGKKFMPYAVARARFRAALAAAASGRPGGGRAEGGVRTLGSFADLTAS